MMTKSLLIPHSVYQRGETDTTYYYSIKENKFLLLSEVGTGIVVDENGQYEGYATGVPNGYMKVCT